MEESREPFFSARTREGHRRHHHADLARDVSRRTERNRVAAGLPVLGKGLPDLNSRDTARIVAAEKRFASQRPTSRPGTGENIGVLL